MIKYLDGIFETVAYGRKSSVFLLYINKEFEDYPIHWHTATEIIMPLENDYTVIINKVSYALNEGDILIIPPGELHELVAPPKGVRIIFQFDFSIISQLTGFNGIFPILMQPHLLTPSHSLDIHMKFKNLLLDIIDEYLSDNALSEASIYTKVIQMFIILGRKHMGNGTQYTGTLQKNYIEKFNQVFDYIDKNYAEDISLEKIADIAGFSKFHFSRLFKQFTNKTFNEYLNQTRVRVAESQLLNPNLSITDVAMQSGFSSISTFNRVFKSIKKCTPSEFKGLHCKEEI
ncbi:MAG: helix-turn-helix transcriptional regulator [Epulopiscium sp.]|nr:helix-turn-helix transcriptional regulator [Candidatus Epulonipiscium sp.]